MGNETPLQVLKVNDSKNSYVEAGWTDITNNGLLNGSNIIDGYSGTIFQDSFGNLWTMGNETSLQVLKANDSKDGYVETGWWTDWTNIENSGLLNGSNIVDGFNGTIFQDSSKNLWTMGNETSLQVLKVNDSKDGYVNSWQN